MLPQPAAQIRDSPFRQLDKVVEAYSAESWRAPRYLPRLQELGRISLPSEL
jgi:hypothetical protein